jgi:hypothetical protein
MRLKEERTLVLVEILLLIFVVLTGVAVQVCSIQIDAHNSELLGKLSTLNLAENVRVSQKLSSLKYLFAAFADANVDVGFEEAYGDANLHPDYKKIVEQYESGAITKGEYFNRLSVRHNRDSMALRAEYLKLLAEKDQLMQTKPICFKVRSVLFILQFAAIVISIAMYYWIHQSIRKRIK